jgi:hypothetical protein
MPNMRSAGQHSEDRFRLFRARAVALDRVCHDDGDLTIFEATRNSVAATTTSRLKSTKASRPEDQ